MDGDQIRRRDHVVVEEQQDLSPSLRRPPVPRRGLPPVGLGDDAQPRSPLRPLQHRQRSIRGAVHHHDHLVLRPDPFLPQKRGQRPIQDPMTVVGRHHDGQQRSTHEATPRGPGTNRGKSSATLVLVHSRMLNPVRTLKVKDQAVS